jgi:TPR repeat protein
MLSRLNKAGIIALLLVSSLSSQGQAIADLIQKAQAGDAKAQFELAKAYQGGQGVPLDRVKSIQWLRKSADQGYAGAEVTLGAFYESGALREVPGFNHPDPHEAAKWFRKAARQSSDAQHAHNAQGDLSKLLSQGLISKQEADWRTSEPGAHTANAKDAKKGPPPFSLAEVEAGLTGGMTDKRIASLVNTYGVNFGLTATARKRLVDDGADDNLLAAISASHR